jgi:thiosulfate reductase/polysulfide reductase chain A
MKEITRRDFVKIGMAASLLTGCGDDITEVVMQDLGTSGGSLTGNLLSDNAGDYTAPAGDTRKAIPSACWQCVARDGIIGYVENGRLEHLRGNPNLLRTNGKLCARGQGGVDQLYDPDRILFPMKQTGQRGDPDGWVRVSWDDALDEIVSRIQPLRASGEPEKFMFHYGRMKASSSKMIKSFFLPAYGTKTIGNHTSICEGAKWTSQELTWGAHYDVNDVENTNFILNFGCNVLETHTNHIPLAQRVVETLNRGVEMHTFDVRLSNTAAKSTSWIPIRPGTDLAVLLAMAHVIMVEDDGPYDSEFINEWTGITVNELKNHLNQNGYTPEWAAPISGVSASTIRSLARKYAQNSYANTGTAGASVISYRGAVAHYNGVICERACMMLEAICGNIDRPGGRLRAVGAKWHNTYSVTKNPDEDKLKIIDGLDGDAAYPDHHISHRVLDAIEEGSHGRPEVYMIYCYNPVYANGDCQRNIRILKDKSLIPYYVAVDTAYSEGSALADLIIPDASYLERWDWEDMVSMKGIKEYYIRQPMVAPLGEARDFKNVCVELASRMGFQGQLGGWTSAEEFVKDACNNTDDVVSAAQAAGYPDGFSFMKAVGAWYDPSASAHYENHRDGVDTTGAILDGPTGVWWNGNQGEDYTTTSGAYKKYVGQQINGTAYKGFPPDVVNKSGLLELKSALLESKGFPGIPAWMEIPEHQNLGNNLILTTFKVSAQTHSRTQNCKRLSEIYHTNPAWIHPDTASALGISDGDTIRVTNAGVGNQATEQSSIVTKARVTPQVVQGVVAVSHHCGHWQYGRYATANQNLNPLVDEAENEGLASGDLDTDLIWWTDNGVHPNWIIPNSPEPISGQHRWMDTVVTVTKA